MASRLVTELLFKIAQPISSAIRKGKPVPTLLGAMAGAGAGATVGLLEMSLLAFGAALGALVGAVALAAAFPKPVAEPIPEPEPTAVDETRSPGSIRSWWFAMLADDIGILTVLLEHAIYRAVASDHTLSRSLLEKVEHGEYPRMKHSDLVFLDDLEYLDFITPDDTTVVVVYRHGGQSATTSVTFTHVGQRDEFITALEEHFGQDFLRTERAEDPLTAGLSALMALAAVVVVFGAAAGLSWYWIANPPMPPRGKPQGDELVLFLQSVGPQNILLIGLIPTLLCLGWLGYRLRWPPTIPRLSRPSAAQPNGEY
jgi:hypothetical protein